METETLLSYSNVRQRVKTWFFAKNHSHAYVRSLIMGTIVALYMGHVSVYLQVVESVKHGELPWYVIDALIVGIASVEAVLAPYISWLGYRRRRTTMMAWLMTPVVPMVLALVAPAIPTAIGTEFCNANSVFIPPGVSTGTAVKLIIFIVICVSCSLALIVAWSHGLAYMNDHSAEGLILHFGIIIAARAQSLLTFHKMLKSDMEMYLQVLGVISPLTLTILQMLRVPEYSPPAEEPVASDGRGFCESLSRVLRHKIAVMQMCGIGLLVAALWGFAWHESDLIKVQYLAQYPTAFIGTLSDLLRCVFIFVIVVFAATKFSQPVMTVFSKVSAARFATILSVLVIGLYVAMGALRCNKGNVAGLVGNNYTQPTCSVGCGCLPPFNEFSPVCMVDQMMTYLSPCHAGCTNSEVFAGITALSNCTCGSVSGRAVYGACSDGCSVSFELHKMLYIFLVIFTVLMLQAQGILMLRSVDSRDRSLALGLSCSIIALFTYIFGHAIYLLISVLTCNWTEGGRCQFHTPLFPYLVGGMSAVLVLISCVISIFTWLSIRRESPKVDLSSSSDIEL